MQEPLTLVVGSRAFQENRIFSSDPAKIRDRANECFIALRSEAERLGFELATEDLHPPAESKLAIDLNVQRWQQNSYRRVTRYLLTLEPPVTYPDNWSPREHDRYEKIFTWNDHLVDNRRYFLLRYGHNLGVQEGGEPFDKRKFAAAIVGFKLASHPQELYSERFATLQWFVDHHPDEFALFGVGWSNRLRRPCHRRIEQFLSGPLDLMFGPFVPKNPCYFGPVSDKIQTLGKYKFAFCYENTDEAAGYITEKIFDAFRAGCIPVYLGPPNVSDHIPEDCFINRRQFTSHESLYARLRSIGSSEFCDYQGRIRNYTGGELARQFTPARFANILVDHIRMDIGAPQDCISLSNAC